MIPAWAYLLLLVIIAAGVAAYRRAARTGVRQAARQARSDPLYQLHVTVTEQLAALGHDLEWARAGADSVAGRCTRCPGRVALGVTAAGQVLAEGTGHIAAAGRYVRCAGGAR